MFVEKFKAPEWWDYAMLEMSIIPIPHEWKRPDYEWRRLKWTKLHVLMNSTSGQRTLTKLFQLGEDGLAVVCGRPSENLFVIDCDTIDALHECKRQLLARGIKAPCVLSSRGGHVYLRAREGCVQTIVAGKIKDIEIRGDGALAVLPPTRHKSGVYYRWETGHPPRHIPTVSIGDIDFLCGIDGQPVQVSTNGGERRLHDSTHDYLIAGHQLPEGTRNERLFDAARDFHYIGRDSRVALYELLPIAMRSGLDEREATATILSPYKNLSQSKPKTVSQTDYLEAFLKRAKWEPRTRKTDMAVFAALIKRRKDDGYNRKDGAFRASVRELKVLARINSNNTIRKSINRMIKYGYIEIAGKDKQSKATLYRITPMVIGAGQFFCVQEWNTKQQCSVRSTYCVNLAHPLSESVALGITATNILGLLRQQNQLMTTAAITKNFDWHRTTTTRNLHKLMDAGLIERKGNSYRAVAVSPAEEQALVMDSGAYAADKARREQVARDRAMFALGKILDYLWNRNQEGKSI